jgi:predicted dehydrogenase
MKSPDGQLTHEVDNTTYSLQSRRSFMRSLGVALGAIESCLSLSAEQSGQAIQGFEEGPVDPDVWKGWAPISDKKIRMGLVGYGASKFSAAFGFQNHPNVEIVAVSDLIPERCAELAKATRCSHTYPSLEELVKDNNIEAVFVTTDAPSHLKHVTEILKHGKHVACSVPAVWGSLEDAENLFEVVKSSDRIYMMFETSAFREEGYAMRQIYNAGGFGRPLYTEGEYYHYMPVPIDSFKGWRIGLPPQWYPTHSNAFHICVTGGSFTEVTCLATPSKIEHLTPGGNRYGNPYGTEVALFRTSEGGMARMCVSWDTPGFGAEAGRLRGQKGTYNEKYEGLAKEIPNLKRPPLPPGVLPGGHGGAHGYLTNEFVSAVLQKRKPLVDIATALNLTVPGIVAHQSALKGGETLKIPQYKL